MAGQPKPRARWASPGVLKFHCSKCHREAVFEQVDVSKMILNGDADDDFDIIYNGSEITPRDFLWPQHVCRNETCDRVETVRLPPYKV